MIENADGTLTMFTKINITILVLVVFFILLASGIDCIDHKGWLERAQDVLTKAAVFLVYLFVSGLIITILIGTWS